MNATQRYLRCLLALVVAGSLIGGCGGPVPPSSAAMLHAAADAYRRGDDGAATERLAKFLTLHPHAQEAGEALYLRGLLRCRGGDWLGAEDDFLQAIELTLRDDLHGRIHLALAYCAQRRGDDETAQVNYQAALDVLDKRSEPTPQALYGLATSLQRQGQWAEADRRFDRLTHLFAGTDEATAAERRVRARAWTVRLGVYPRREGAARHVRRLAQQDIEARLAVAGREPVRFIVLAGRHPTREQAIEAASLLDRGAGEIAVTLARD